MPPFEIRVPGGLDQVWRKARIREATAESTRRGKLRPNSVDSLTGKNSGDNLGPGTPVIHFEQWERDEIDVRLILKGGGCENTNAQYAVPVEFPHLGRADRTLDGARKCILHAVWQASGRERRACLRALRAGDLDRAIRHALTYHSFDPGDDANRLLTVCHLHRGDWLLACRLQTPRQSS